MKMKVAFKLKFMVMAKKRRCGILWKEINYHHLFSQLMMMFIIIIPFFFINPA